jgi:hypothetical protein
MGDIHSARTRGESAGLHANIRVQTHSLQFSAVVVALRVRVNDSRPKPHGNSGHVVPFLAVAVCVVVTGEIYIFFQFIGAVSLSSHVAAVRLVMNHTI